MIEITIHSQPNDFTCGPTSLHAVYQYYGDNISLDNVISEVGTIENGGTLAPLLGLHALNRGYECTLHPYNLYIFDPTWFYPRSISITKLIQNLERQHAGFTSRGLQQSSDAHIQYLKAGGKICMQDLNSDLLNKYFSKKIPVLTGLSATYLYRCARETEDENYKTSYDDINGLPSGHFVVLYGYHKQTKSVIVADPLKENPHSYEHHYFIPVSHLLNSVMLGVLTNDANILIIHPRNLS